jgi:hypothetical protein
VRWRLGNLADSLACYKTVYSKKYKTVYSKKMEWKQMTIRLYEATLSDDGPRRTWQRWLQRLLTDLIDTQEGS